MNDKTVAERVKAEGENLRRAGVTPEHAQRIERETYERTCRTLDKKEGTKK